MTSFVHPIETQQEKNYQQQRYNKGEIFAHRQTCNRIYKPNDLE